jgi:excinuclease ABC subunit A
VIELRGVRVHNLRSIDVTIPRNRLTVISGVSGSGKSSLAFDTIYAEGRRRYVECLSTYQQQFLERMARPDVDHVDRLPPAIAIERGVPAVQARSTVGTTTEISDYLRLLFARIGRTRCIGCESEVEESSAGAVADRLIADGGRGMVTFELERPESRRRWGLLREELMRDGFVRLCSEGTVMAVEEAAEVPPGTLAVVVDRVRFEPGRRSRIAEAVETAYRFAHDRCLVFRERGGQRRFSRRLHCPDCDQEYRPPHPNLFSPNSPLGACPACQGFGRSVGPDLERIIPDRGLTLSEGAVDPWNKPSYRRAYRDLRLAGRKTSLPWDVSYRDLSRAHRRLVEEGGHGFYGVRGFFDWLETKKYKLHVRVFLSRYRAYRPCPACSGRRLRPEALAVRVNGEEIGAASSWPVSRLLRWVGDLDLGERDRAVAAPVVRELSRRLEFLEQVGLSYLDLERPSRTLSGGEAQRIHLARSLGSSLVDTLYVLDEPSVGLHPQDVDRLIAVLTRLRDRGNTVVVVEHDPRVIRRADWIVDLGPGAGAAGGVVTYQGPIRGLRRAKDSVTAAFLNRSASVAVPRPEGRPERRWIQLEGASIHNLRDVDASMPRESLTVVTGVSGSGKSSLIHDTLHGALSRAVGGRQVEAGPFRCLSGVEGLSGVELVDQSPLGRSPRSNPVTYVKAFDGIRKRFAATALARARGHAPAFFSFNVRGGRCEACDGAGSNLIEMHFLPDMIVPCEACSGARFGPAALEITDRGRNVAQVLKMTVAEALEFYAAIAEVARKLRLLNEIGLGYLQLGQPAPTLSGGEAQRLKLAAHLALRGAGPRVFLLDEPTTGLHLKDVTVLIGLLRRLIEAGHTVVVVEHHLDLMRAADWIVEMGPGAGVEGGRVVAAGTPGELARGEGTTAAYLRGEDDA